MLKLKYSLVVEATHNPDFFGVYCPELGDYGACTATGATIDEAIQRGIAAVDEFVSMLLEDGEKTPPFPAWPSIRIVNEGMDPWDADPFSPSSIRRLRERLSLTQRDFATVVGVDPITVSRWERGASRPRGGSTKREILRLGAKDPCPLCHGAGQVAKMKKPRNT